MRKRRDAKMMENGQVRDRRGKHEGRRECDGKWQMRDRIGKDEGQKRER